MIKTSEHRLGDLCKRFSSGKGITAERISETGDYPVIGGNGLRGFTDTYNFDGECAVIGRQGAYCGNVQFFSGKGYMTEHAVVTEPNDSNNAKYLTYKLSGLQLGRFSGQAAQPGLSVTKLARLRIEMPPKWYQDKVADIISSYDNLIEVNNKRIKVLKQMAENLYKDWFVRFRFPGHETAEFENGIPKGWTIERLGNIASISTGKSNRQDADENGVYPFFDRSQETKRSNIWLKDCEAIIIPGEGTTFYPRYYHGKFDLHQRCYCVEPRISGIGKFLFYVLKMNRYYFLSVATGATVPSLRQNNFLSMKFIMPAIGVCREFNAFASDVFAQIDYLNSENKNLIKQRDLLLPRLMSGKQEV